MNSREVCIRILSNNGITLDETFVSQIGVLTYEGTLRELFDKLAVKSLDAISEELSKMQNDTEHVRNFIQALFDAYADNLFSK